MSGPAMRVLREGVGLTMLEHVVVLRVEGPAAFTVLNRLSTAPLYLREGQMRQTLFLHEDARPFADVLIASDEGGFWVLAEGASERDLLAYVERYGRAAVVAANAPESQFEVRALTATHQLWGLNGPYAWEVTSALLGPAVLGMTYLSLLVAKDVICFRGGKTGEYGYDLLVPAPVAARLRQELEQVGLPRGLQSIGLVALDQAALENWHFNMRTLDGHLITPLELQLQWRVGYDRDFVGAEALRALRARGPQRRGISFTAAAPVATRDRVALDDRVIGEVLAVGWSDTRQEWTGIALVDVAYAHPRIDRFLVRAATGPVAIRTLTPPLINNRSLYVDPHRHAYQTRVADNLPPLVLS